MSVDHAALRVKYRRERDKRLRPDGNDQYLQPTGRFASMLDDPYTATIDREPRFDEVTVALIGGGFSGLCVGARLKQAGIDDVRIIEVGGDFGGAWYWNRYPGAMCDTAAMIYLPLLEETGHVPSAKYVMAPEIFEHCQRIATTFDLYDNALLSTASPRSSGTRRPCVGLSAPTAATSFVPGSSPWVQGPSTGRSSPASPGSRPSPATPSTPAAGTTRTPAATGGARR
jgi:hypothetical protein